VTRFIVSEEGIIYYLDLEKKEASDSLYCIRRRNHIARSRSREEGSNLKRGGPRGVGAFL
jgi:hypothetical protein